MPEWNPKEAAARGAAFLDEREPGWWTKLDFATLEMDARDACVLGQLFFDRLMTESDRTWRDSPFGYGIDKLGISFPITACADYGFDLLHRVVEACDNEEQVAELWDELGEAWLHEAKERANA